MNETPDLFEQADDRPRHFGLAEITYKNSGTLLTPASGFMGAYDFTLNPYSGCAFACSYCYAAFFTHSKLHQDTWGKWVTVKQNALALLRQPRRAALAGKSIYMSSVTDPYQPIEKQLTLTREILQELAHAPQPKLVIQTRSPLVARDIDVLRAFDSVQVNMTVTTDSEEVRRAFEPACPNNRQRLEAIKKISDAGIQTAITMTPLLPVEDAEQFAALLLETGVQRFVVQPFHTERGKFVAGTREAALATSQRFNWNEQRYSEVLSVLRRELPHLGIGKQGFAPPA